MQDRSGGAFAMAERILKVTGEKHVPMAMSIVGYIVSIPVFSDSGFVILSPLNRAISRRAKIPLATSATACDSRRTRFLGGAALTAMACRQTGSWGISGRAPQSTDRLGPSDPYWRGSVPGEM